VHEPLEDGLGHRKELVVDRIASKRGERTKYRSATGGCVKVLKSEIQRLAKLRLSGGDAAQHHLEPFFFFVCQVDLGHRSGSPPGFDLSPEP